MPEKQLILFAWPYHFIENPIYTLIVVSTHGPGMLHIICVLYYSTHSKSVRQSYGSEEAANII